VVAPSAQALTYGAQVTLPFSGLSEKPIGLAVDPSGDVFVADAGNNRVVELPAGCQSSSCQLTVPFSGLDFPNWVAVDPVGDLFVTDTFNNRVVELPAGCDSSSCQLTLPFSDLNDPFGVAVDPADDVFVTEPSENEVLELPAGSRTPVTLPFSGLDSPFGVTVDPAGDVLVAEPGQVVELPAGCETSGCQVTVPFTELGIPVGVTVDPAGDVFVADAGNKQVVELPAGSNTQVTLPFSGLELPQGIGLDPAGDVFVVDTIARRVVELPVLGSTQLSTTLSGGSASGLSIAVPAGTGVSDQATLSGASAASASGSVTYNVYADAACTLPAAAPQTVSVTDGTAPASTPVMLPQGTYFWTASYSGDGVNDPSQSACGTETSVVLSSAKFGADVSVALAVTPEAGSPPGSASVIRFTVSNDGPEPASDVISGLALPSTLAVLSAGGASQIGNLLFWPAGTFAAGQTDTHPVLVRPRGSTTGGNGMIHGDALSLGTLDPNYGNNFVSESFTVTAGSGRLLRTDW
jgi:serine/threonine-protein kinase